MIPGGQEGSGDDREEATEGVPVRRAGRQDPDVIQDDDDDARNEQGKK